jgi:hypothetical protein
MDFSSQKKRSISPWNNMADSHISLLVRQQKWNWRHADGFTCWVRASGILIVTILLPRNRRRSLTSPSTLSIVSQGSTPSTNLATV